MLELPDHICNIVKTAVIERALCVQRPVCVLRVCVHPIGRVNFNLKYNLKN
jgi:hypothetical protein